MIKKQILSPDQSMAANPNNNVWVQANAGTGKTSVLIERLLQILFKNADNDSTKGILCLTYTNAAAGEMRDRILKSLGAWATMSDDELRNKISGFEAKKPVTDIDIQSARNIFYKYIDNPEILKIKTLHGFCEEILHRFPLEAGLPPTWNLIQGVEEKVLLAETFHNLINKNLKDKNSERIISAFETITEQVSENFINDLLQLLAGQYKHFFGENNNVNYREQFIDNIRLFLNLNSEKPAKSDDFSLNNIISAGKDEKKPAKYILDIIELTKQYIDNTIDFQKYKSAYLKADGNITSNILKKDYLIAEAENVYKINQYTENEKTLKNTIALFDLTDVFAKEYKNIKLKKNVLDFNDMILYTKRLFSDPETMGWVLSQLDLSINQILVDEAQDTSPEQWEILKSITENLFTDGTSDENQKALFVVGDSKQSIYGFQGADTHAFAKSRDEMTAQIQNNLHNIKNVSLKQNFRSAGTILKAVDFFFDNQLVKNVTNFNNTNHEYSRNDYDGLVEIYAPTHKSGENEDKKSNALQKNYIKSIADKIEDLINNENMSADDIMILVQRRKPFAMPLLNELKRRKIPVQGSDRIKLPEFPAIRDLLHLLRFCINNANEYSLCCLLKSPYYRLTEQDIFNLCKDRESLNVGKTSDEKKTVFDVLNNHFPDIYNELKTIIQMSEKTAPYSFFSGVFNQFGFREKVLAAFGRPAIEPLDEFFTICLAYERTKPGTLKHFLKWFITGDSEIKRDLSTGSGVKITTVHGSKGLEAPAVFIIDSMRKPDSAKGVLSVDAFMENSDFAKWIWKNSKNQSSAVEKATQNINQSQIDEYFRLLYVAMTRARDRLYVFGMIGQKNLPENAWFTMLQSVLSQMPEAVQTDEKISITIK